MHLLQKVECIRDAVVEREAEVGQEAELNNETWNEKDVERYMREQLMTEVPELKTEVEELKSEVKRMRETGHEDAALEPAKAQKQSRHLSMTPSTLGSLSQCDDYHDKSRPPSPPPASFARMLLHLSILASVNVFACQAVASDAADPFIVQISALISHQQLSSSLIPQSCVHKTKTV